MRLPNLRLNRARGRRKSSQRMLPPWASAALVLCILGLVALVVRGLWRHDTLMTWRRSLEVQGERIGWPPWNPRWPPLPPPPHSARTPPSAVAGAAAFAALNADVMRYIPCYCGACPTDHTSNLNCYVTGFRQDGTPMWTDHASTCPICVSVTREVMLMTSKGWPLTQIRETLDREYESAGYRLSTVTPHPVGAAAK